MKVRDLSLSAGVPVFVEGGNFFMLIETSAPVDVLLWSRGTITETAEQVEGGYKASPQREQGGLAFDRVEVRSAVGQTVKVGVALGSGGYDRSVGDVSADIPQADTLTDAAAVAAVTDARSAIAAAVAGRKMIHVRNAGAAEVAIGGAGVVFAASAIRLLPGEEWREEFASAAAWYAVCDAGQSSSVAVLTGA